MPPALERVRRRLGEHADGDRQMVGILAAVTSDRFEAVDVACAEALAAGPVSRDVVLNILTRQRQSPAPLTIVTPDALRLRHEARADGARYDSLRSPKEGQHISEMMGELKLAGMRHASDEVIADAVKRQHPVPRVVGDLVTAEINRKRARSIKYHTAYH